MALQHDVRVTAQEMCWYQRQFDRFAMPSVAICVQYSGEERGQRLSLPLYSSNRVSNRGIAALHYNIASASSVLTGARIKPYSVTFISKLISESPPASGFRLSISMFINQ